MKSKPICNICNREIEEKDNYVKLTDYKDGEFYMEGFYHTQCYNQQVRGVNPEQKAMKMATLKTLMKANKLMERYQE